MRRMRRVMMKITMVMKMSNRMRTIMMLVFKPWLKLSKPIWNMFRNIHGYTFVLLNGTTMAGIIVSW